MARGVAPTRPSAATAGTLCPKVLPPFVPLADGARPGRRRCCWGYCCNLAEWSTSSSA